MQINLYLILFVILLGLSLSVNDNPRHRRLFIVLCSSVLLFVAAMRSPEYMTETYGIDSLNYKWFFENSLGLKWSEVWSAVSGRYRGINDDFDVGYVVLNKIVGLYTHDFHIFSLLADLLFFIPFGIIIYRFTTNISQIVFAFVFYISLIQVYLLGGGRQMYALGLDMMAFLSIIDRKRFWTVLFFILGLSIHFSSLLFLLPLLMVWLRVKPLTLKVFHLVGFILIPIVLLLPNQIISFMGGVVGIEKYAEYGKGIIRGGSTTFIVLIELLSLFCMVAIKKKDLRKNSHISPFYVMAPLFTIFSPLVRANGTMIRIALYYFPFLVLLVPYGIDCLFKRNRTVAYYTAIIALSLLTLAGGGMTYYFYWQV